MENNGEQSREESPMYSDSYLLPILQKLPMGRSYIGRDLLLKLVEDCITRATGTIEQGSKDALLEGRNKRIQTDFLQHGIGRRFPQVIGRLGHQITYEILNGNDTHSITLKVLKNHLVNFLWEDKATLTLAAFALTFGDLWLLVRIYAHNVVNEPVTTDRRELTSANKEAYRNQIEANNELIKILIKSLRYLFDILKSRFVYAAMTNDQLAIYVYWIVRCAIVAATQIFVLSSRGLDQYLVGIRTPAEVEKLKSLTEELMCTLSKLREGERAFNTIDAKISNKVDIVEIMKVLITDEDMPPLYHGETKRKDHLDVLRGKRVLLLISRMDIPFEDITSLKHVTIDTEKDEIVWIPVINRSIAELDSVKNQLETLQNSMSWYSVQPSMVTHDAIYFFELKWDFKGTPILVLLSPSGKVLRDDAIHMMRIWQNLSVDDLITYDMEEQLWEKETWNLKLLVNDIIIDPIMQKWIQDERYIIMYGGNDIEWIRRFTRQVHSIASDLHACIEMIYVGNRHNKDLGCGLQKVILIEQLSHCLPESNMAYFWTRIDSMIKSMKWWYSNPLEKQLLRFRSHEEWALLARGSTILVNGSGQIALNALEDMEKWRTKLLQS